MTDDMLTAVYLQQITALSANTSPAHFSLHNAVQKPQN